MKKIYRLFLIVISIIIYSQKAGVRELKVKYKNTMVEVLVLSKPGDENKTKPLFVFCQGSLARPLQIFTDKEAYPLLPFSESLILEKYHLVLINKPGIPIKENIKNLNEDFSYPKDGLPSKEYIINNNLNYYYQRNNFIVKKF